MRTGIGRALGCEHVDSSLIVATLHWQRCLTPLLFMCMLVCLSVYIVCVCVCVNPRRRLEQGVGSPGAVVKRQF